MLLLIALATFCATLLGGYFAVRLGDRLHLILGFSAGAVIGVAFFDLLPEALTLSTPAHDAAFVLLLTALGFLAYLALDRTILIHGHNHDHQDDAGRGHFGAGALSLHSFLDGLGIGLAFQLSSAVGIVVAVAVLAHDFSDGINTVSLVTKNGGSKRRAFQWLLIDAAAPALGMFSALFISIPIETLGLLLSVFAGFFLYIGASDLIPESHHAHPVHWTTISTVLGALTLYVVVHLAGL